MAAVVQGVIEVRAVIGQPPVIVGGLAVLSRLANPHRATVDLDVVDRLVGPTPHLEVLRSAEGSVSVEPAAVELPTQYGPVKVDVLEVRQAEIDRPSDDPGDRLHAFAHAWANDTATNVTIEVERRNGEHVDVTTPVAEPGPLIAMKLQAVMNRSAEKQGTDLLDIIRPPSIQGPARSRSSRSPTSRTGPPATSHSTSTSGSSADAPIHSAGSATLAEPTRPTTTWTS